MWRVGTCGDVLHNMIPFLSIDLLLASCVLRGLPVLIDCKCRAVDGPLRTHARLDRNITLPSFSSSNVLSRILSIHRHQTTLFLLIEKLTSLRFHEKDVCWGEAYSKDAYWVELEPFPDLPRLR